jgi:hypothetical protein
MTAARRGILENFTNRKMFQYGDHLTFHSCRNALIQLRRTPGVPTDPSQTTMRVLLEFNATSKIMRNPIFEVQKFFFTHQPRNMNKQLTPQETTQHLKE